MSTAETYILFELAGTTYGIRSADVLHVEMLDHITPVPNSSGAVEGVVFSRGRVIPALNLRTRFNLPPAEPTSRTRLVFMHHADRTVALIVDSAREFRTIPPEAIRPVADTLLATNSNFITGVAQLNDRLVLLLDPPAVLDLARPEAAAVAPTF